MRFSKLWNTSECQSSADLKKKTTSDNESLISELGKEPYPTHDLLVLLSHHPAQLMPRVVMGVCVQAGGAQVPVRALRAVQHDALDGAHGAPVTHDGTLKVRRVCCQVFVGLDSSLGMWRWRGRHVRWRTGRGSQTNAHSGAGKRPLPSYTTRRCRWSLAKDIGYIVTRNDDSDHTQFWESTTDKCSMIWIL